MPIRAQAQVIRLGRIDTLVHSLSHANNYTHPYISSLLAKLGNSSWEGHSSSWGC